MTAVVGRDVALAAVTLSYERTDAFADATTVTQAVALSANILSNAYTSAFGAAHASAHAVALAAVALLHPRERSLSR